MIFPALAERYGAEPRSPMLTPLSAKPPSESPPIAATCATVATAAEQRHFTTIALQHDLCGVFLNALLVGPFAGLQLALSAPDIVRRPAQIFIENHPCHSVFSRGSPVFLSFQRSDVAIDRLTIFAPSWVDLTSGSRPRFPTRMTLFTLPAMLHLLPDASSIAGDFKKIW